MFTFVVKVYGREAVVYADSRGQALMRASFELGVDLSNSCNYVVKQIV